MSAGQTHSAVVTGGGELYTWGWGEHGRLGHGDEELRVSPCHVKALASDVAFVQCGGRHTVALTRNGSVMSWGWNEFGQLGYVVRGTHEEESHVVS